MNTFLFYCVFAFIILIILTALKDIGIASVIVTFMMLAKFTSQIKHNSCEHFTPKTTTPAKANKPLDESLDKSLDKSLDESLDKPLDKSLDKSYTLSSEIMNSNESALDEILSTGSETADDRIFNSSIISGDKERKAKEIRSHWNNKNWKRMYDYELSVHDRQNKDWWTDDDFELSKKHVVF